MCGIIGVIATSAAAANLPEGALARGLTALSHRGPDASGTIRVEGPETIAEFGHARLAIIDLSPASAQPMVRRDGRHTLVFNGEVYNYKELRESLRSEGATFVSDGDTEVVFEALMRWGPTAVTRFVGMFAIAWWDRDTETLVLARDRVGIKPLYWHLDAGRQRLVFASEGQALVKAGLVEVDVAPAALHRWGHLAGCADPETLLAGVQNLLPGQTLTFRPGEAPHITTFWTPTPAPRARPPAEQRTALAATLDAAVADRLIADVPLGVFLSGGVDSTAIAAIAARHVPERLETFTLAFGEAAYDERDRAARIARHLGVRHHVAVISPAEALAAVEPAFAAQDFPSHDGVNTWLVSKAARAAGLVVCLSGTGGDELFGGYRHFHALDRMLAVGRAGRVLPRSLPGRLDAWLPARTPTRLRKALGLLSTAGEASALADLVRQVFTPAQRDALFGSVSTATSEAPRAVPAAAANAMTAMSLAELAGYIRNTQLRDIDAMSMAHGLEVRVPLLDHRVIALALALPESERRPRQGLNKPALVEAAGLPVELMRAPKMGFTLPWEAWLRKELRAFAEDALFGPSPAPVSTGAVQALWRDFLAGRPNVNATRVLALISLRLWFRRSAG